MTTENKLKQGLHGVNAILILVITLTFLGLMTFGRGLGDLFTVIALSVFVFVSFILTIKIKDKVLLTIFLIIAMTVLLGTIIGTTTGRGPENKWNGKVFVR